MTTPASRKPGIGGTDAFDPVAMTKRSDETVSPLTSTVVALVNRAAPLMKLT